MPSPHNFRPAATNWPDRLFAPSSPGPGASPGLQLQVDTCSIRSTRPERRKRRPIWAWSAPPARRLRTRRSISRSAPATVQRPSSGDVGSADPHASASVRRSLGTPRAGNQRAHSLMVEVSDDPASRGRTRSTSEGPERRNLAFDDPPPTRTVQLSVASPRTGPRRRGQRRWPGIGGVYSCR